MNAFLSPLQTHSFKEILPEQWAQLSSTHAREVVQWAMEQTWEHSYDHMYEGVHWINSALTTLLEGAMAAGHSGAVLDAVTPTCNSANLVLAAHALQVGRNTKTVDDSAAKAKIMQALDCGDAHLVVHDFDIWFNDMDVVRKAWNIAQTHKIETREHVDVIHSYAAYCLYAKSPEDELAQEVCQLLAEILDSANLISIIIDFGEQVHEHEAASNDLLAARVGKMLSNCSEQILIRAMGGMNNVQHRDALLPLIPQHMQTSVAHNQLLDGGSNAQKIRLNTHLSGIVNSCPRERQSKKM